MSLLAMLWLLCCLSLATAASHHPVNLSIFYPLSTNQDKEISTNLRLSVLYGHVGRVKGLDLNGLVSLTSGEMRGVQINGAVGHLQGGFHGVQASGLLNYVSGESFGLQVAGLVNYQTSPLHGVQYATLFNYAETGFHGAQLSSVFNLNDADGGILQLSSIANVTAGDFRGLQISGLFNYANQHIGGAQLGFMNFGYEVEGVQLGAINSARDVHGYQIGLVNKSKSIDGIPIGPINLSKTNSRVDGVISFDDKALLNFGLRTIVNAWYSVLSVGFWDQEEQRKDTVYLRWNYGHEFPLGKRWYLMTDLGYSHIIPQPTDDPSQNGRLHFALQARAAGERRTQDGGAFFGGVGIQTQWEEYSLGAPSRTTGLVFAGVTIF